MIPESTRWVTSLIFFSCQKNNISQWDYCLCLEGTRTMHSAVKSARTHRALVAWSQQMERWIEIHIFQKNPTSSFLARVSCVLVISLESLSFSQYFISREFLRSPYLVPGHLPFCCCLSSLYIDMITISQILPQCSHLRPFIKTLLGVHKY